jgi:hypothetical protein
VIDVYLVEGRTDHDVDWMVYVEATSQNEACQLAKLAYDGRIVAIKQQRWSVDEAIADDLVVG